MKALLTSRLTAWAATLAAIIVGWLVSGDFIKPPAAETAAGELTTLLSALFAAALGVLAWVASILLRKFTGGNSDDKSGGGSGGIMPLAAMAGIATWGMLLGGASLTSCTPAQVEAFKAVPITIGIEGEHGTYGYSAKGGLSVAIKAPRVREEKSRGPDVTELLEREWGEGRYAPGPLAEWPPIERKPRRLVLP